jgi:hypothetical protein
LVIVEVLERESEDFEVILMNRDFPPTLVEENYKKKFVGKLSVSNPGEMS